MQKFVKTPFITPYLVLPSGDGIFHFGVWRDPRHTFFHVWGHFPLVGPRRFCVFVFLFCRPPLIIFYIENISADPPRCGRVKLCQFCPPLFSSALNYLPPPFARMGPFCHFLLVCPRRNTFSTFFPVGKRSSLIFSTNKKVENLIFCYLI